MPCHQIAQIAPPRNPPQIVCFHFAIGQLCIFSSLQHNFLSVCFIIFLFFNVYFVHNMCICHLFDFQHVFCQLVHFEHPFPSIATMFDEEFNANTQCNNGSEL